MVRSNTRQRGLFSRMRRTGGGDLEIVKSEEEWRRLLTAEQFRVLRRNGTERAFSNEMVRPDADGLYRCAGCDAGLFRADAKFNSGTGWPSFTQSEADGVELHKDYRLGIPRTEVRCRRCGGHLGHVFNDGPGPNGKRYCINGCALSPGTKVEPRT